MNKRIDDKTVKKIENNRFVKKLEKGSIYHFKYLGYHLDKYPIALILYSGKEKTHAININYLTPHLRGELIDMIASVAVKKLNGRDTYSLYHNHIKRQLPKIISVAYRTYYTHLIKDPKLVSKGFWEIKGFLHSIRKNFTKKEHEDLKKKIKKKIVAANSSSHQDEKIKRLHSIWSKKIDIGKIDKESKEYFDKINKIIGKPKIDWKKYTKF